MRCCSAASMPTEDVGHAVVPGVKPVSMPTADVGHAVLQGVKPVSMPIADIGHAVLPSLKPVTMPIAVMPSTSGKATVPGNVDTFATASISPAVVPLSGGATVHGSDDTWATGSIPPADVPSCGATLPTSADEVPVTDSFACASIPTANQPSSGGGLIFGTDDDVLIPDTPSLTMTFRSQIHHLRPSFVSQEWRVRIVELVKIVLRNSSQDRPAQPSLLTLLLSSPGLLVQLLSP
jgi:hypothetical protein